VHPSISDNPDSGTTRSQGDNAMSFAASLDLFAVYWAEETRHELRFSEWLEKQAERDRVRSERIAAATRSVEKDKLRVERELLIKRRGGRGFRQCT
jgi:hypothetical protein